MKPLEAALVDEACAEIESLGQVDGIVDSPYVRPGQRVEVEGVELEEEERSMKGWCQVRRKSGQEEKEVSTETRGREEFYKFARSYPYLAHYWRYERWSEERKVKERTVEEWKKLQMEVKKEGRKEFDSWTAYWKEVLKWWDRGGVD